MEIVPKEVAFAVAKLEGFNRNRFRLETNGATSAGPSSIVTLSLPSNASAIDLRSFKVHMDVTTTTDATSTNAIYSKLPADASSLIQSMEVYCGGVQISQSFSEFNTVSRVKKLIHSSRDRDGSVDGTLSHGVISDTEAVEQVSLIFKPTIGLFAESSTRYLNTAIVGDISVRLTLAPNSVLAYREATVAMGNDFSDAAARTAVLNTTYSVLSIHATIDTCTLGDSYERMLMDRLASEQSLNVNFKEYYTYALKSTTGTAHDVRFSLSASSIDSCYTVSRDANYETAGIKTRTYSGASLSDSKCANFFHFKSFNNSTTARGSLRFQYSANNVQHPQYQADVLDAASDLIMLTDQHGYGGRGNMVSSLADFNDGKCILPLVLNMPSNGIAVSSGLSSRGNNTQFSISGWAGTLLDGETASHYVQNAVGDVPLNRTVTELRSDYANLSVLVKAMLQIGGAPVVTPTITGAALTFTTTVGDVELHSAYPTRVDLSFNRGTWVNAFDSSGNAATTLPNRGRIWEQAGHA